MKLLIVTGMSGSGKNCAMSMLEDMGYFCVENLPVPLIGKFAELFLSAASGIQKAAVMVDIRSGKYLTELDDALNDMERQKIPFEVLFLTASDACIVKRYKETRRSHPLAIGERMEAGIREEREKLEFLRKRADYVIDTTQLLTRELNVRLHEIFDSDRGSSNLYVTILSFGFKNGIPADADLVFDVRFLPNPYYDLTLRPLTGNEEPIREFVMRSDTAKEFCTRLNDMIRFLLPHYVDEGKNQLVIAIGCTGGKHRSVVIANELYMALNENRTYGLKIEHRDIGRERRIKGETDSEE